MKVVVVGGEGLEDALAGVEVVGDAPNESPRGAGPVLVGGTKRLLRATQFHTLVAWFFAQTARWRIMPTGNARLQPIDPIVVAQRLADAVHADPAEAALCDPGAAGGGRTFEQWLARG